MNLFSTIRNAFGTIKEIPGVVIQDEQGNNLTADQIELRKAEALEEVIELGKEDLQKAIENFDEIDQEFESKIQACDQALVKSEGNEEIQATKQILQEKRSKNEDKFINKVAKFHEGIEKAEKELEELIEKGGVGSKGGKVIGTTQSNKPIYESHLKPGTKSKVLDHYASFSKQDHIDAQNAHNKILTDSYKKHGTRSDGKIKDSSINESAHRMSENYHKTQVEKEEVSKADILIDLQKSHNLDLESAERVYQLAVEIELSKGGIGSGVRGHTTFKSALSGHKFKDYDLDEKNQVKAEFDIQASLGFPLGNQGYARFGDIGIRVKDHTPDWSNFNSDIEDDGLKKIINVTVGDFNNSDYRRNKTSFEEIKKEHPNVEFINIDVKEGDSIQQIVDTVKKHISGEIKKSEKVEIPKDEFIEEHKNLVKILEEDDDEKQKKEAKKQKKELSNELKKAEGDYVAIIYTDHEGKLLLMKREDNGQWMLPGGHVDGDERPDEAAFREFKEETNLDIDKSSYLVPCYTKQLPTGQTLNGYCINFYQDLGTSPLANIDLENEATQLKFMSVNEWMAADLFKDTKEHLKEYFGIEKGESNDLEKAEGDRGGIVVGHTNLGYPIYEKKLKNGENASFHIKHLDDNEYKIIAKKGNNHVGDMTYIKNKFKPNLIATTVQVDPNHRGQGIGSLLYELAEKQHGLEFVKNDNVLTPDGKILWESRLKKKTLISKSENNDQQKANSKGKFQHSPEKLAEHAGRTSNDILMKMKSHSDPTLSNAAKREIEIRKAEQAKTKIKKSEDGFFLNSLF
jgi:8-oxo-dGTP pyrophosphatase MutT (NUDIX family)/predicted GNAT family acetyltransferase